MTKKLYDDNEYSSLSEYEYSEDESEPPLTQPPTNGTQTKKNPAKKKAKQQYEVEDVLMVPQASTYSALSLYQLLSEGEVDLCPEYQRDVVWTTEKQMGLIDSMLRNYYIPPVIFSVKTDDFGTTLRTCIDGKQRLTSIHRFMEGQIPYRDPKQGVKLWYKVAGKGSSGRELLPETLRKAFDSKQVVCVEYNALTENNEREIFQRVQLGMALTPAERLQAQNSYRAKFIRSLVNDYAGDSEHGLGSKHIDWQRDRANDFRRLAEAACIVDLKSEPGSLRTMPSLSNIEKWMTEADGEAPVSQAFKKKMQDTLQTFTELIDDKRYRGAFGHGGGSSKVAPLEIVFCVVLIARHKDDMNHEELARAIKKMRKHLRDEHVDIRSNNRVAKTVIEYVNSLEIGGEKKKKAKKKYREDSDVEMEDVKPSAKEKKVKKKRYYDSSDEEDVKPSKSSKKSRTSLRK